MSIAAQLEASVLDAVRTRLDRVSRDVQGDTVNDTPMDTGALRTIIVDDWAFDGARYTTTIKAPARHASWVEEGTGIYGPTGQRIYPRSAPALVFYWRTGPRGPSIYAFRSVAGQRAQPFFFAKMPDRFRDALRGSFG